MKTIAATSETIECTLNTEDRADVGVSWQEFLRTSLVSRETIPGGLRLTVKSGCEPDLERLIDIERECCRWITVVLDGPTVALAATGEGEQAIRALWSPAT